jgi:hypothetical protein
MRLAICHDVIRRGTGLPLLLRGRDLSGTAYDVCLEHQSPVSGGVACGSGYPFDGFDADSIKVAWAMVKADLPAHVPDAPGATGGEGAAAYDPDAYMPVKELREKMDPPWGLGKWTKIKAANPWIRFDPKSPKQRPRIHRADACRLEKGKVNPDTFELLDSPGEGLPSLDQLTDEYLADAAARKAEIQAEKRRGRSD